MQRFISEFWDLVETYNSLVEQGTIADDNQLMKLFREQEGQLSRGLLKEVARWKTGGRTVSRVAMNSDEEIALANQALHDQSLTDEEKLGELCKLYGVRLPTASVILAFSEPKKYSVIDYRVCEFLCNICGVEIDGEPLSPQNIDHWAIYQGECKKLLKSMNKNFEKGATLRDLDRAMWIYHKWHPDEFKTIGFTFENLFNRFAYSYVAQIESGKAPDIPFSEEEKELFCEGVKEGLIEELGHRFNFKDSSKGPYNIFSINREYITHAAAYIKLVRDLGFKPEQCKIEYKNMDIAIFVGDRLHAYLEAKASDSKANKLIEEIKSISHDLSGGRVSGKSDAFTKAEIIHSHRPDYFVIYTPTRTQAFKVKGTERGFELLEADFHGSKQ